MARQAPIYCFGCGRNITDRPADRRALDNPRSQQVVQLWKAFLEGRDQPVEDADKASSGGDSQSSCKMCRKCFSAYERYNKLYATIQENLRRAAEVLQVSPLSPIAQPLAKRPRLGGIQTTPSYRGQQNEDESTQTRSDGSTKSPQVAVHIRYKNPKKFVLTPHRKNLARAVARQNKKTIAIESLKDPVTKKHVLRIIGREVAKEVKRMASDKVRSVLKSQNVDHLKSFHWNMLLQELSKFAPILSSLFTSATKTRVLRPNTDAVIGMCVAILLNHHNPKMNLVQKINSLILYAGHSSKQVYQRLQRLNLTTSHSTLIRLLEEVGKGYDNRVQNWRDAIVANLDSGDELKTHKAPWNGCLFGNIPSSDDSSSDSDSDSDSSWKSFSPITSDDDDNYSGSSCSGDEGSLPHNDDEPSPAPANSPSEEIGSSRTLYHSSHCLQQSNPGTFRLCGDNIDKGVKQRHMRVGVVKPNSIHYFHSYALADRVDVSKFSEQVIPTQQTDPRQVAISLLPGSEDDAAIRHNISILISRVLFANLSFFKLSFDGVVKWHIQHEFYEEMSAKSDVVPLGILPKNENKGEDMVAIMAHLHQYAPLVEENQDYYVSSIDKTVKVTRARARPILIGGDQLTVARARGAQKATANALSPSDRLEGLVPMVEDWHAKVTLLSVIWKYFYSHNSVQDCGTLYQIRNRLNRTNVVKSPKNEVNACEDFIDIVTSGLIVASTLTTLKLKGTDDTPGEDVLPKAEDLWAQSDSERRHCLNQLCRRVYDRFVNFSYNVSGSLREPYASDGVCTYSVQLLRLGCFYMEFSDAIREGDGRRVLRCWKYMLPMFLASGKTNYAYEAANLLLQHFYTVSPRLSAQLLWSRFVNVHGLPGKNIAADLHMEHLNRIAKEAIRFQGSNRTEKAIDRVGRSIGTLFTVLDNFDTHNQVPITSSRQAKPDAQKDIKVVADELVKCRSFEVEKGRKHSRFPNPKNVLNDKDREEVLAWLVAKLPRSF